MKDPRKHKTYLNLRVLFTLLSGILFSANQAFGDNLNFNISQEDAFIPSSPVCSKFMRVTSPQPALLTGAVQFSVPLYTIECDGYDLPFSLEYKSNGIKVFDDPFPFGYGWSLLPALRVYRRVMGRPDGEYDCVAQQAGNLDTFSIRGKYEFAFRGITPSGPTHFRDYKTGEWRYSPRHDLEHDLYTIMLPERNLTVIWDPDSTHGFVGVQIDEYKISTNDEFDYIEVVDPYGRIFHFGEAGETNIRYGYKTEWLLSWIELSSGRRINFEWQETFPSNASEFQPQHAGVLYQNTQRFKYDVYPVSRADGRRINEFYHQKILKSVIFTGGVMSLSYRSVGLNDLLSEIKVNNSDNEQVFTASLEYSTQNSQDNLFQATLSTINIAGTGTYRFSYHAGSFVKRDQDWWGYANGRGNTDLNPAVIITGLSLSQRYPEIRVGGGNRNVNEAYAKTHLLKSAQYPTGATVEWGVESHLFPPTSTSRVGTNSYITNNTLSSGSGCVSPVSPSTTELWDRPPTLR